MGNVGQHGPELGGRRLASQRRESLDSGSLHVDVPDVAPFTHVPFAVLRALRVCAQQVLTVALGERFHY